MFEFLVEVSVGYPELEICIFLDSVFKSAAKILAFELPASQPNIAY